ncbi:MAG TPA: Mur ligase family protein [Spirochaetota bacterium]|nr:Mur ligase family protein [Spirochaetota bacterium]
MSELQRILDTLINNEKSGHAGLLNYTTATMRELLRRLDGPHRGFKSVHIAGTNGKGSTAHMLSGILSGAGYKTGLYISPHLERVTERISINGRMISERRLAAILRVVLDQSRDGLLDPTYFDALTAAAFKYFHDESVDIAVVETGLGGRLDSTNVLSPMISIITAISLDHTKLLGPELRDIATEKAGIIKPRVPVVTCNSSGDAFSAIAAMAREKKSALYIIDRDFQIGTSPHGGGESLSYSFGRRRIENIRLGPRGSFQTVNAALAITAALLLGRRGFPLSPDVVRRSLGGLVIPGRLQIMSEKPHIIFDPAHNPDALRGIVGHISMEYPGEKPVFVVCFMKDKDIEGLFLALAAASPDAIIYYPLNDERAYIPDPSMKSVHGVPLYILGGEDADSRLRAILGLMEGHSRIIVATGSFRIYPAVKRLALLAGR